MPNVLMKPCSELRNNGLNNTNDVASPCISICVLDENDVCQGCYRSAKEITEWSQYDNAEKSAVLDICRDRLKQEQKVIFS